MATQAGTLGAFNDFMLATRQRPMTGPDKIVNMASRHRTFASRVIMSGLNAEEYFQDGTEIVETVQLNYTGNARDYLPTADQNPSATNSLVQFKVPWRFTLVDTVWYDHEIILNNGDSATVFKKLKNAKRQTMYTDFWDHVNDDLWALPHSDMEGGNTTGATPYSLLCFAPDDGTVPKTTELATGSSAFTTIHQLNTTTYPNWCSQYVTYDSTNWRTTLLDSLDEMWLKVQFEAPEAGGGQTGIIDTSLSKCQIFTNREGYLMLVKLARDNVSGNKTNANLGEFNGKVYYNQMQVKYISALDSTTICASGKPKFFFFNFNHIRIIFHKNRYLYPKTFEGTLRQPMANAEYRDTWWNLVCKNRREQGVVRAA